MHELSCWKIRLNDGTHQRHLHQRVLKRPICGCRLERLHVLHRWSVFRHKRGVMHELCRRSICGSRIKRMQQLRSW